jgi:hypothetical protein
VVVGGGCGRDGEDMEKLPLGSKFEKNQFIRYTRFSLVFTTIKQY